MAAMQDDSTSLDFHGGLAGGLAPLLTFLAGVGWLGITGAPDERGLWPVLLLAMAVGLGLARKRTRYCEILIDGMARPVVLLMVMAWLLAGVMGAVLSAAGLVDGLVWAARGVGLSGGGWVATAFLVCCAFSTAAGTSLGTLVVCAPILYPAGAALGADPVWLAGALIGGATFGDNISPVSDTTIASAVTQGADMGGVVRSRMRYALPAAGAALVGFVLLGGAEGAGSLAAPTEGSALPLVLLVGPALVIAMLVRRCHLVHGLLTGIVVSLLLALGTGLLAPTQVMYVEVENFAARGLIVDGLERGLGVSVFTILLMGLVGALEATGVVDRLVAFAARHTRSQRGAEGWIVGAVSGSMLLTAHSSVAILAVGRFARESGEKFGIGRYRRANLMDATVCTFPFILPYFVPTILAASLTAGAESMPRLSAWQIGAANLHSWGLLVMVVLAVATGYGRREE